MKTFVMGDLHGANKALLQCLERSGFNKQEDTLIQIGDVADGWGETAECVDTLLSIKNLIPIRGNHDVWVYDWFELGATPHMWISQGGKATLESYVRTGKNEDKSHREFWKNQKDWYIDEKNCLFIHAGWDYLTDEFPKSAKYPVNAGSIARECHWDRSIFQNTAQMQFMREVRGQKDAFKKVESALNQFKEVYIGHTALKNSEVYHYHNLWNMDSGCGWNGRLAIMDIDTKQIWYSDYSKELYPDEKGRR